MHVQGIRSLVITAVLVALVAVATMVIQVPMPGTKGFVNIGDTIIFVGGGLFGGTVGLVAGGLGSALADLLAGYPHWAPWTLIIKGIEGLIVGLMVYPGVRKGLGVRRTLAGLAVAGLWMVFGYFLAATIIYGSPVVAATSIGGNVGQAVASIALAIPLIQILRHRVDPL